MGHAGLSEQIMDTVQQLPTPRYCMSPLLFLMLYDPRFWMLSWPHHTPD